MCKNQIGGQAREKPFPVRAIINGNLSLCNCFNALYWDPEEVRLLTSESHHKILNKSTVYNTCFCGLLKAELSHMVICGGLLPECS